VAFSLVYNSQCFYAKSLMDALAGRGIKVIMGGPADTSRLSRDFRFIPDEEGLTSFLIKECGVQKKKQAENACEHIPDFSDFSSLDYLSLETIIPIKASCGCCYGRCAFCTHHKSQVYRETSLETVGRAVRQAGEATGAKYFFFIDDLIPTPD
jgi:radical SAM superfamily enzyme YgiQ (UPF0313 family)